MKNLECVNGTVMLIALFSVPGGNVSGTPEVRTENISEVPRGVLGGIQGEMVESVPHWRYFAPREPGPDGMKVIRAYNGDGIPTPYGVKRRQMIYELIDIGPKTISDLASR